MRRAEGGAKNLGVFRVKNHDFTSKNHIFSNFRGGARRVRPLDPPLPLVEQELLTLPGYLSLLPAFSGVRVTRSLVLCVCFVDRCLSFCPFSFGHCVVCSSSIYVFWLPLWYLQTLLTQLYKYETFGGDTSQIDLLTKWKEKETVNFILNVSNAFPMDFLSIDRYKHAFAYQNVK